MKLIPALLAAAALMLALVGSVVAKGSCTADAVGGQRSTDWFNAFGFGLDPSRSWTVSFSVPVIPFPTMGPPTGPLTSFPIPAYHAGQDGSFKGTFRARDAGVDSIRITVTDGVCTASHVLSFVPNTATDASSIAAGKQPPLAVLLVGAAIAAALILFRPRNPSSSPGGRSAT